MKIIQFLLSLCAIFIGVVYVFGQFDIYISLDMIPYYYLLLGLGMVSLFMFPYMLYQKQDDSIEMDNIKIEKNLIHQLIEEEIKGHESLSLSKTIIETNKEKLIIKPKITVMKISDLAIEKKTTELEEQLTERMVNVFGEKKKYQFQIMYLSK